MLDLNTQILTKSINFQKALKATKGNQVGIIDINKENQKELTKYLNIRVNEATGYEKIDLDNPLEIGSVDLASYGSKYYDIFDNQNNYYEVDYSTNSVYEIKDNNKKLLEGAKFNQKDSCIEMANNTKINLNIYLKAGISIMLQKNGYDDNGVPLENAKWDIYPNPNPYGRYTSINEMKKNNPNLIAKNHEVETGYDIIDKYVNMHLRTDKSTVLLPIKDALMDFAKLGINLISQDKSQKIDLNGFLAIETDKNGQQFVSHGINNDINGNPIGYNIVEKSINVKNLQIDKESIKDIMVIIDKLQERVDELEKENKHLTTENRELKAKIQELELLLAEQSKDRAIG